MKLRIGLVLGASACLLVAGCGNKAPSGQVAATVDGKEITMIDLRNEMGGFKAPDAKTRKAAEQAALDQIVTRKLLATAARDQKLDKTPEYAQEKDRLEDLLLVRLWQNRIAKAVPQPSKDEVDRFIAENPDLYAAHKVLLLDQIQMPRVNDPALYNELKPLKTLPEVAALLTSKKIPYRQGTAQMDAFSVPPQVLSQILKLPSDDVFVLPQGNVITISHVNEVRVTPVPAEAATKHATQYLRTTRAQEAVQRELSSALARERAKKGMVEYAKAYQPAAKPAKAAATPAKK
jgi:EpsD family peptidyl-prolyl cis-trans isomerase